MDLTQYNAFELHNNEQRSKANISKKTKINREKNILLSNVPPLNCKTSAENIIPHRPGVKPDIPNAKTPVFAWNVFLNKFMFSDIVKSTNATVKPMVDYEI